MGGIRSYCIRTIKIKNFLATVTGGTFGGVIRIGTIIIFGGISTGRADVGCTGFPQRDCMVIITNWLTHTGTTTRGLDDTINMM